jgi:hypothetical protein
MLKIVAAVTAFLIASPTLAQTPVTQPAAATDAKPRIICEKQMDTGSRLGGRKVCHTKEEWDALRAETRSELEKNQRQNTSTGTPSGMI